MNELRIIRGKDVELRLNGSILFGMTEFSVREKKAFHEVHECLSSGVVARIPQEPEYEIRLKAMSMFDSQFPQSAGFSLSLRYEDEEYVYGGCRVVSREKQIKGIGDPESVYVIAADTCIWQEVEEDE